jgi:transposase InsO family protein
MSKNQEWLRKTAAERAKTEEDHRAIWTSLGQSRSWFYKWLQRSQEGDEEWFRDRPSGPNNPANRSPKEIEDLVQFARLHLYNREQFCGSQAIRWYLEEEDVRPLPSLSTIGRILRRRDLTHKRTGRYRPKGVPYPAPEASRPNGVHQADFIGPRFIRTARATRRFYVLNAVDLATGRCAIETMIAGKGGTEAAIWAIWRRLGLPRYCQVDNEMVFCGSPLYPHTLGPLARLCLPLGVEPVFIPPREPWRNGVVEKFNGYWDQQVWKNRRISSWSGLRRENGALELRHNRDWRYGKLNGKTPLEALAASGASLRFPETPTIPADWPLRPESGKYHLIRFIRSDGHLDVFGEKFAVDPDLRYEYVWATVDVKAQRMFLSHDGEQMHDWKYVIN